MKYLSLCMTALLIPSVYAGSNCESTAIEKMDSCLKTQSWTLEYNKHGNRVYMRHKSDSDIYELFLTTKIAAAAEKIYQTLVEFDRYTEFMPDTLACSEFVNPEDTSLMAWQRINFNWLFNFVIDDQYYLIDVELKPAQTENKLYRINWKLSSDEHHQQYRGKGKRCTRGRKIKANNGYWEITQINDEQSSVNYYLHTAPSGWLVEKLDAVVAWVTRSEAPETLLRLKKRVE